MKTKEPNWKKISENYRVEFFKPKNCLSLWRKNPKGFFNFVDYLNSDLEEEKLELIKKDYYEQKSKKTKKIESTDDDFI